ncbi:helix-turn-helix transcriptional regulator [Acinetobacter towneri]|uniref:helix-turn-helix transcriptional regulator n=1 Tax=Acinetobacter towneri TaxID=202956 RepID=UPI00321349F6
MSIKNQINNRLYVRMNDLATTAERKPRTYKTKDGRTINIKGKPAKQGLLPMGESTIWEQVRAGKFPQPVKLTERVTAWRISDIEEWMRSKGMEV